TIRVCPHLPDVVRVVPAYAIDPVDGKALPGASNLHAGDDCRRKYEFAHWKGISTPVRTEAARYLVWAIRSMQQAGPWSAEASQGIYRLPLRYTTCQWQSGTTPLR